jgi:hypothetical protein
MKKNPSKFRLVFSIALVTGILLGKMDTLPHWDDTGITAFLVVISTFIFGWLMPSRSWLWAILTGGCIVFFNLMMKNNLAVLMVFFFSFGGAYAGVLFKKLSSG